MDLGMRSRCCKELTKVIFLRKWSQCWGKTQWPNLHFIPIALDLSHGRNFILKTSQAIKPTKWHSKGRMETKRDGWENLSKHFLFLILPYITVFHSPSPSKDKRMEIQASTFCCELSRWVVNPQGRGHVYILQAFQKYLL